MASKYELERRIERLEARLVSLEECLGATNYSSLGRTEIYSSISDGVINDLYKDIRRVESTTSKFALSAGDGKADAAFVDIMNTEIEAIKGHLGIDIIVGGATVVEKESGRKVAKKKGKK